ncbi:MAG: NADH-quinone oxidoreductase subunit J [SAR202 cluster bacterium]|nr:NADH-quinone oxidoreductase subunit J [SAR202 cluster bacterium]
MTLGTGTESALITDIIFWTIAISSIVAAIAVVQLRDLFRAALFLVVTFAGIAGLFVMLRAEFLAIVQIVIYIGAISVLLLFAVLTTRDVAHGNPSNKLRVPAAILALSLLAVLVFVSINTDWNLLSDVIPEPGSVGTAASAGGTFLDPATIDQVETVLQNTIPGIADLLLRDFVLAFEAGSVLLLAAIVAALALVRETS